jgi:UDP-N-acetylmuramate--alanine ligase
MFSGLRQPVHFIGIAGYGMSGLAELCLSHGLSVSGSDLRSNPMTEKLAAKGAKIFLGHEASQVKGAGTVVLSSAIDDQNPEVAAAKASGADIIHRSDLLAQSFKGKKAITVAGTHGKTTTTAMLGYMLEKYGLSPTIICGGVMNEYKSTVFVGQGDFVVAEADESDGSFLKYQPFISVITNVDFDHMEYFKDRDGLCKAFLKYAKATHKDGTAVVGWDSPLVRDLISSGFTGAKLAYGFLIGSEVRAFNFSCKEGVSTFSAVIEKDKMECQINMIGRHNVQNALCCLGVARALGLDLKKAAAIIKDFPGVKRRQEAILKTDNVTIFDDYAHNPGKISALVNSIRDSWQDKHLIVAFQPHRFSRLDTMYDEMIASVAAADEVFVLPVYAAGEVTTKDYSAERLAREIQLRSGKKAYPCTGIADATSKIEKAIKPGSIVVTVGAGDVTSIAEHLRLSQS